MKRSEHQGVVPAETLEALLAFMASLMSPGIFGRKKNTLRFGNTIEIEQTIKSRVRKSP